MTLVPANEVKPLEAFATIVQLVNDFFPPPLSSTPLVQE